MSTTTISDSLIAGSISGVVTRFLGSPLDLLKVRLQLQIEPTSSVKSHDGGGKYRGMFHAARTIYGEEGIRAFWKGFLAGQALYVIFNTTQFVTYELAQKSLTKVYSGANRNFICGFFAGGCGTLMSFPFDVLRTRLLSQGEPKVYTSLYRAVVMMYAENGIRTFYKGLTPALASIAPQAGINFGVFKFLCGWWDAATLAKGTVGGKEGKGGMDSVKWLACGGVAGITSKLTMLPFDIVKKRMEIQGFERAQKKGHFGRVGIYKNPVHCLMSIIREEGSLAFYKGATPALLKATIGVSVSFAVYEKTLKFLHQNRGHQSF